MVVGFKERAYSGIVSQGILISASYVGETLEPNWCHLLLGSPKPLRDPEGSSDSKRELAERYRPASRKDTTQGGSSC
jgi:hypothetical protein